MNQYPDHGTKFCRLLLLALTCCSPVLADEIHKFDWLTSGRINGHHVLTIADDGSREVDFEYLDRGRGPKTHEITRFDGDGRVVSIDISGRAYMGAEVFEQYRREGDTARWQGHREQDATQAPANAVYIAANGTSEQTAILARALLDTPGQTLPVLPSGEASINRAGQATVGPEGGQRTVLLYEISGLDLMPTYVWLDEDRELFALSFYWMGMVPEGWAAFLPELTEVQRSAELRHQNTLAGELTQQLSDEYVIDNIHVVDVEQGVLLENRLVVVRDGRIATMGHQLPEDFAGVTVDGGGGYLIPGLWDMHTHLAVEQGIQHIAAGVTTTRDVGNNPEDQQHVRTQFASGEVIGPTVIPTGFIDKKSPFSAPIGRLATSRRDALNMVDMYAEMGYPQIKLYSSIRPRWVKKISQRAHGHGMRVSGHVPNGMDVKQAVRDGYDEIQHINMVFLYFLNTRVDTRTAGRVTIVAEGAAKVDLSSRRVTSLVSFLADNGTVVDPTAALFHGMLQHVPGEVDPSYAMIADHLPPTVQRNLRNSIMVEDEAQAQEQADDAEAMVTMVGILHRGGVRIVAGTDATPGFLYHRELELYVRSGISNADVLHIATLGAAEVMGMEAGTGSIAVGKQADLVVLASNPLENISAVRNARLVIKGQRAWQPDRLYQAMGIRPFSP